MGGQDDHAPAQAGASLLRSLVDQGGRAHAATPLKRRSGGLKIQVGCSGLHIWQNVSFCQMCRPDPHGL